MSDQNNVTGSVTADPAVRVIGGSFEDAVQHGRRLLDEHPEAALRQAETLLRSRPDSSAFRLAGAALRALRRPAEAEQAELAAIQAAFRDPELEAIAIATAEGRNANALESARIYLDQNEDDLLALTLAAEAAINCWELETSEKWLRTVLERAPSYLRASILLATCLSKQIRPRAAIAVLEEVVRRKPNNAQVLTLLAQLRAEVRDNDLAVSLHERLVELEGDRPGRWVNLAQHYRIVGRSDDAVAAFRQALSIDPNNGSAWWSLANYFRSTLTEEDETAIREALELQTGAAERGALSLALGLIEDAAGDYPAAFADFAEGKKLRLEHQPYDPEPISTAVNAVIRTFDAGFIEKHRSTGFADDSPIFILGMPRSGTTLVEQILGRHSQIEAAGELQIAQRLAEAARHEAEDPEDYAGMLRSLDKGDFARIGERYVTASAEYRASDKPHFTDKNNLNWLHIGLILLSLPKAKVIDVRRSALDCCWANFKMLFADRFPATNDLRHVGRFYRDYVKLIDFVATAMPGRILQVCYEDVVADIEGQTQRILDYLQLPFEADCLDFHRSTGAIATASSEQVRQPLNRRGIGSADSYRAWLGPLIEELGPLAAD